MIKGSDVRLADKWGTTGEHVSFCQRNAQRRILGTDMPTAWAPYFLWYPGGFFLLQEIVSYERKTFRILFGFMGKNHKMT